MIDSRNSSVASKPQTGFANKFYQKSDLHWIISVSDVVMLDLVGVRTNVTIAR